MSDVENLFDLSGKTALVTGGSRGLGREIVLAFAHAGADVVIASRKLDSCEQLAEEVRDKTGQKVLPIACHVGDWDQVDQLADAAYDHFGKVDILVNNAGMSPLYDNLSSVSESLYDKVLDVNLKGPFRLTALIGSRMAEGDGGSVIMDLAVENGGNCELTKPGEIINCDDVIIDGSFNIPGTMPIHASQVYAKNVSALINYMCPDGVLKLDMEDEIVSESMFTHNGEITDERTADALKGES